MKLQPCIDVRRLSACMARASAKLHSIIDETVWLPQVLLCGGMSTVPGEACQSVLHQQIMHVGNG